MLGCCYWELIIPFAGMLLGTFRDMKGMFGNVVGFFKVFTVVEYCRIV